MSLFILFHKERFHIHSLRQKDHVVNDNAYFVLLDADTNWYWSWYSRRLGCCYFEDARAFFYRDESSSRHCHHHYHVLSRVPLVSIHNYEEESLGFL